MLNKKWRHFQWMKFNNFLLYWYTGNGLGNDMPSWHGVITMISVTFTKVIYANVLVFKFSPFERFSQAYPVEQKKGCIVCFCVNGHFSSPGFARRYALLTGYCPTPTFIWDACMWKQGHVNAHHIWYYWPPLIDCRHSITAHLQKSLGIHQTKEEIFSINIFFLGVHICRHLL